MTLTSSSLTLIGDPIGMHNNHRSVVYEVKVRGCSTAVTVVHTCIGVTTLFFTNQYIKILLCLCVTEVGCLGGRIRLVMCDLCT